MMSGVTCQREIDAALEPGLGVAQMLSHRDCSEKAEVQPPAGAPASKQPKLADDAALVRVLELEMPGAHRECQHLRDQVEVGRGEERHSAWSLARAS